MSRRSQPSYIFSSCIPWLIGIAIGGGLCVLCGLGYIILEAARLSQYDVLWKGLLVALAFDLVLDLTLGLALLLAFRHSGESGEPACAERMAA